MTHNLYKKYLIAWRVSWIITEIWKRNITKKIKINKKEKLIIYKKEKKKNLNSKEKLWSLQIN